VAIGCLGLAWGLVVLPRSEATDDLRAFESLLRSEAFAPKMLRLILESPSSQVLNACDTHSQRALLLMEMPLTNLALRSGTTVEVDRHFRSLDRSREILGCTPRESFVWLLTFYLETLHGRLDERLDERSFDLLAMSYETSPNEAWISIRRVIVALPLAEIAPTRLRQKIFDEFQQLVENGFTDDAARAYSTASQPVRSLILRQIQSINEPRLRSFTEALRKYR
jgi:hypothetical protein